MGSKRIFEATLAGCCVLALGAMLALPGTALAAKPVCNDGICQGNEPTTCPQDCEGGDGGGGGVKVIATFRDCTGGFSSVMADDLTFDLFDLNNDGFLDCTTPDDRIYSDALGPYVVGKDQQIQKHSFFLSPSEDNDRWIVLDFEECVDEGLCGGLLGQIVLTGAPTYVVARTTTKQDDLLRMPVYPADGSSIPVTFRITFRDEFDKVWRLKFAPGDEQCEGSDLARVTRISEDTWVFEAGPNGKACLFESSGFRGLYHMPFQLVVVSVK